MRYNQLTYHKANPFFKQDYLPDRAWYNRKPKEYPSQIPTGQEYFTDSGRKHYQHRFNHSEISEKGVLTSPEKYPFENRIAMDKAYMRSLDTTDIEGAGSGTRVNEAVRHKLRAQEDLARRHNQSLDLRENKEHQYEEKRRGLALKQYQTMQLRQNGQRERGESSRVSGNPEREGGSRGKYQGYQRMQQNEGNTQGQYIKLLPRGYTHLEKIFQAPQYTKRNTEPQSPAEPHHAKKNIDLQSPLEPHHTKKNIELQSLPEHLYTHYQPQSSLPDSLRGEPPTQSHIFASNDRHQSNPAYMNHYDQELQRRRKDYLKTIEIDQASKDKLSDRKQFRKNNPTNLSFNLAGQSIVGASSRY